MTGYHRFHNADKQRTFTEFKHAHKKRKNRLKPQTKWRGKPYRSAGAMRKLSPQSP